MINVLHNEYFPLISEPIQRFLQSHTDRALQCHLSKQRSSSDEEGRGLLLEYPQGGLTTTGHRLPFLVWCGVALHEESSAPEA